MTSDDDFELEGEPEEASSKILSGTLRNVFALVVVSLLILSSVGTCEKLGGLLTSDGEGPAALRPSGRIATGTSEVTIRANPQGHFLVEADVNGEPILFLVDTGASSIMLTPKDARRLGIQMHTLDFSERYQTANGVVRAAPVTLRSLGIGQLRLSRVPAVVNGVDMSISLLGTSFLRRLASYEVRNDRLVLSW